MPRINLPKGTPKEAPDLTAEPTVRKHQHIPPFSARPEREPLDMDAEDLGATTERKANKSRPFERPYSTRRLDRDMLDSPDTESEYEPYDASNYEQDLPSEVTPEMAAVISK
jgi:hypothetical protein